jgi:hypothetical protein
LKQEVVEKNSGFFSKLHGEIPTISKKYYRIVKGLSVGGDAPKELLRIYTYIPGKRTIHNPNLWGLYIVKTGHKWYPYETITEFILNRLGQCLGLSIAEPKIAFINGQIRFLSKIFLSQKGQILEHGADIYSSYIKDKEFVEEIENQNMAREFFTLRFTKQALDHTYPNEADQIFSKFCQMIVFDAIIGNNDRHFYNWGVIKHLGNDQSPCFSPLFDTARGLLWNYSEERIKRMHNQSDTQREKQIGKYIRKSKPKIGIENKVTLNHISILDHLYSENEYGREIVHDLINKENAKKCDELLKDELRFYMSIERFNIVRECLNMRFHLLMENLYK